MENILKIITLRGILTFLLILSALWLFKIIVKRQSQYLFRAGLLFCLLLVVFVYLQQSESKKWTLEDVKQKLFPEKMMNYEFEIERGGRYGEEFIRYVFYGEIKPKLSLKLDKNGRFLHISDVKSINKVLNYLGLPPVSGPVPELISITNSELDIYHYEWKDYPRGTLTIERTLCRGKGFQTYHCISSITLKERY